MKGTKILDLSIIVPIYNVEDYLHPCLSSIEKATSTLDSVEIICVNDGSTDDSAAIIDDFCLRNQTFLSIHKENGGYGHAINAGLDLSRGRYITIVESDDIVVGAPYQQILEILDNNQDVSFVKTPYFIWEGGIIKSIVRLNPESLRRETVSYIPGPSKKKDLIFLKDFTESELIFMAPSIWSGVYRKSALDSLNIRILETPGASYQDTYFSNLVFLNRLKHAYLNSPYYLYRYERPDSSRNARNKSDEIINIFRRTRDNLKENGNYNRESEVYFYVLYFLRMVWFFPMVAAGARYGIFQTFHDEFSGVMESPENVALITCHLSKADQTRFHLFLKGDYLNFTRTYTPESLGLSQAKGAPQAPPKQQPEFSLERSIEKHIWSKAPIFKWFGDGAPLHKLQPVTRPFVAVVISTLKFAARVRARRRS